MLIRVPLKSSQQLQQCNCDTRKWHSIVQPKLSRNFPAAKPDFFGWLKSG